MKQPLTMMKEQSKGSSNLLCLFSLFLLCLVVKSHLQRTDGVLRTVNQLFSPPGHERSVQDILLLAIEGIQDIQVVKESKTLHHFIPLPLRT